MSAYSFVSTDDLKDYMSGMGLNADQVSALQDVLDGVQRELERYCRRRFERKERTETLMPDEYGRLWPSATPVVSVSVPTGMTINGNWISSPYGWPIDLGGFAPVETTYVGGLDPDDDGDPGMPGLQDVRTAILRVAAREAEVRHDDTLDPSDLSARHPEKHDKRVVGWTDDELKKFDRLRRRTVV